MKVVYIASPYGSDPEKNTEFAKQSLLYAIKQNVVPLASHLLYPQILDDSSAEERNIGLQLGIELLLRCDEVWVCGGIISEGMQAEIDIATEFLIPVKWIDASDILSENETNFYQELR